MKILFYGETPCNETGAARVNRHLLDAMIEAGHEVCVLATSHFFENDYDHARYPYPIESISRENDHETHGAAAAEIDRRAGTFDYLFISQDMHVPQMLQEQVKRYPSIVLAAIDGFVKFPEQIDSLALATVPAVYSRFSYNQVLQVLPDIREQFQCIQLGCEPDVFFPIPADERREYRERVFGITDDEMFLVMWANRNQMRKDPGRAMAAFHKFHERVPNSRLYMHCRMQDVGGNIVTQAKLLGMRVHGSNPEVIFSPPEYTEIAGFDREKLNRMYNAADVGISSSVGEGWGLTSSEFMAAGRPFIGPMNTTFYELLGRAADVPFIGCLNDTGERQGFEIGERGYLAQCGGDDLWMIFYGRDDAPRPIMSVTGMADALYHVYTHRGQAIQLGHAARKWARGHTWQVFKDQWKDVLAECQTRLSLV